MVADTHTSNPAGDAGYWSDPATWDIGSMPTAGDTVIIAAGDTVYYDVGTAHAFSLAGITVTGTLRATTAATPAGSLNGHAAQERTALGIVMASNANISGAGALYIGNSTTDYIARPAPAATYVPNFKITLAGTGQITVTTQRYYGWVPAQLSTASLVDDACFINYQAWPEEGIAITNEGTAGSAYNGVAASNKFSKFPNGKSSFVFADTTEALHIPTGAAIDNMDIFTLEWTFRFDAVTATNPRLWDKADSKFLMYITSAATQFYISRYDSAGTGVRSHYVGETFVPGKLYTIQVAWDTTNVANAPLIYINGLLKLVSSTGTGASWWDDSGTDAYIDNRRLLDRETDITLLRFRAHSRKLTGAEMIINEAIDHDQCFQIAPAWTKIASTTPTGVNLELDLDLRQGEQIIMGARDTAGVISGTETGIYTVDSKDNIALALVETPTLAREEGDILAVYSRPILITKATYSATTNAASSGIMQGVLIDSMRWTSGTSWTYTGVTIEGAQNAVFITSAYISYFYDCVGSGGTTNPTFQYQQTIYPTRNIYRGCVGINDSYGLSQGNFAEMWYNCAVQNCTYGFGARLNGKFINCIARSCAAGMESPQYCDFRNFLAEYNTHDLNYANGCRGLNCDFESASPFYYSTSVNPIWANNQFYDSIIIGFARTREGTSVTGTAYMQNDVPYLGHDTLCLTNTQASASYPVYWDTPFWMPANKPLTLNIPSYRPTTTGSGWTIEIWIIDPLNDPLWTDRTWALTPTVAQDTPCTMAASYVKARTVTPATYDAWVNNIVQLPAQTEARPLVVRIIGKDATAGKLAYFYLDYMEKALLRRPMMYI